MEGEVSKTPAYLVELLNDLVPEELERWADWGERGQAADQLLQEEGAGLAGGDVRDVPQESQGQPLQALQAVLVGGDVRQAGLAETSVLLRTDQTVIILAWATKVPLGLVARLTRTSGLARSWRIWRC